MAKCGQCLDQFTEEEYLEHNCPKTGFTPQDPEHLGERFVKVSEAALKRGNKRVELEEDGKTPEEAIEETREIGKTVA